MGAVHKFLERFGFVRLRDYGLVLTPDRRVLSNRQAVLDDGYGNRIVGWIDGDLAAMELPHWGAAKALPAPPPLPQRPKPPTPAPQPQAVAVAPQPAPAPKPAPAPAPAPEPEEEDWEWQIAAARAKAAADDEAPAKLQETEPTLVRSVPKLRPLPSATANGSQATAKAAPASVNGSNGSHMPAFVSPAAAYGSPMTADGSQVRADGTPPRTIIPVPAMPVVDPQLVRTYESPRRFPSSTNTQLGSSPLINRTTSRGLAVPAPKRR